MDNILQHEELNRLKRQAHLQFDKLWKGNKPLYSRTKAYKLLAKHLNISPEDCHIKLFDIDTCNKVIQYSITKRLYLRGET